MEWVKLLLVGIYFGLLINGLILILFGRFTEGALMVIASCCFDYTTRGIFKE